MVRDTGSKALKRFAGDLFATKHLSYFLSCPYIYGWFEIKTTFTSIFLLCREPAALLPLHRGWVDPVLQHLCYQHQLWHNSGEKNLYNHTFLAHDFTCGLSLTPVNYHVILISRSHSPWGFVVEVGDLPKNSHLDVLIACVNVISVSLALRKMSVSHKFVWILASCVPGRVACPSRWLCYFFKCQPKLKKRKLIPLCFSPIW